jgi:hypothetical protein
MMFSKATNILDQIHTWSTIYCLSLFNLDRVFANNSLHLHNDWLKTKQFPNLCNLLEDFTSSGIIVCSGKEGTILDHGIRPTKHPPNFNRFIGNKKNLTPVEFDLDKKIFRIQVTTIAPLPRRHDDKFHQPYEFQEESSPTPCPPKDPTGTNHRCSFYPIHLYILPVLQDIPHTLTAEEMTPLFK